MSYSGAAVGGTLKAAVRIDLFLNGLLLAYGLLLYFGRGMTSDKQTISVIWI